MKIRKGDTVRVMSGKDKGKIGKVMQALPAYEKVVIEAVNTTTKHIKGRGSQKGQKVTYNAPIHVSQVVLMSGKEEGRAGYSVTHESEKRVKTRVVRKAKKQTIIA